jgi:hypothetical protein
MRRQTLRKPRNSTRHDHRSSTLTDAIQKPKKTLIPAAALLSLSLSLSMILDDTYYTDLDKTSLAGRQAANSFYFLLLISAHIWLILFVTIYACDHFAR